MGFPIAETINTLAAAVAASAAVASWRSAKNANQTAVTLAEIERDRRHTELRPHLEITPRDIVGDARVLRFRFTGPDDLEPHGPLTVTITVRDDKADRADGPILADGPTREQIAAQIWGPWRLRPDVDEADGLGRTSAGRQIAVGEELLSTVERTPEPRWYGGGLQAWRQDYADQPMRLRVVVSCDGFAPWVFLREIQL